MDPEASDDEEAFVVNCVASATRIYEDSYYRKIPYHTSALTGQGWVKELINGHPERIRTELGVHVHVFKRLLCILMKIGYGDSRYITLEEQLAIFLYTCVTGLSIRHVGERFQRANDTISKFVSTFLYSISVSL